MILQVLSFTSLSSRAGWLWWLFSKPTLTVKVTERQWHFIYNVIDARLSYWTTSGWNSVEESDAHIVRKAKEVKTEQSIFFRMQHVQCTCCSFVTVSLLFRLLNAPRGPHLGSMADLLGSMLVGHLHPYEAVARDALGGTRCLHMWQSCWKAPLLARACSRTPSWQWLLCRGRVRWAGGVVHCSCIQHHIMLYKLI